MRDKKNNKYKFFIPTRWILRTVEIGETIVDGNWTTGMYGTTKIPDEEKQFLFFLMSLGGP